MPAISFNIDHLRCLMLVLPPEIEKDRLQMAMMKSIILFCKVIDINISVTRCSNIDNICLLRKDHKTNVVLKVYGAMTIMRFLHASEYSPYHIYPLYPLERARVDGAMEILLLKVVQTSSNQFLDLIET